MVTYVCLDNSDATLSTLSLDRPLDTFSSTNIMELSSDLGLGYDSDVSTPNDVSSVNLDTSTQVGSETDLSTLGSSLEADTNIATDSLSGLLASTSSTLDTGINLVDGLLGPSLDVASNSETSGPSGVCLGADKK